MGEREQKDARTLLEGKSIILKTVFDFNYYFLWPVRVLKQKFREWQIRRNLRKQYVRLATWTYEEVPEDQLPPEQHTIKDDSWLKDLISEDDVNTKEK